LFSNPSPFIPLPPITSGGEGGGNKGVRIVNNLNYAVCVKIDSIKLDNNHKKENIGRNFG